MEKNEKEIQKELLEFIRLMDRMGPVGLSYLTHVTNNDRDLTLFYLKPMEKKKWITLIPGHMENEYKITKKGMDVLDSIIVEMAKRKLSGEQVDEIITKDNVSEIISTLDTVIDVFANTRTRINALNDAIDLYKSSWDMAKKSFPKRKDIDILKLDRVTFGKMLILGSEELTNRREQLVAKSQRLKKIFEEYADELQKIKSESLQNSDALELDVKNDDLQGNILDTFLSHAHEDRVIARKLADELKNHAFDAFVAHEDIKLGAEWESALLERIKKCDLFIAILSNNFHQAQYTDHEVGIAHGLGKTILPLLIDDTMPYGFMAKIQAKKMSPKIDSKEISKIFKEFMPNAIKTSSVEDDLIYSLINAVSFREANFHTRKLLTTTEFSDAQINLIAKGFIDNDQLRKAQMTASWCVGILKKNIKRIDKKLLDELKDTTYTSGFYE